MLVIDKMSRKPIYEQIVEGIEREIVTGLIRETEQLPSIRELSAILGTNPNTIQKAFLDLDRAGVIVSTPGRGCFVAEGAREQIRTRLAAKVHQIGEMASELAYAGIDVESVIAAVRGAYEAHAQEIGRKEERK
ncbi:MAG: GntR family transcriptional regulator [Clostridia bacterium]|nr:GntR family transcriptional regulator [Clostridia bacterium]